MFFDPPAESSKPTFKERIQRAFLVIFLGMFVSIGLNAGIFTSSILSPLGHEKENVSRTKDYEIFGFAPYWTINKLDNVDFDTLTTLAYFGVPVNSDGTLDEDNIGYTTLEGKTAKHVFSRAHSNGARVVLTITQMDNDIIYDFLSNSDAQKKAIERISQVVASNGFDGVNVDFEYVGDPGPEFRSKFTNFVASLAAKIHNQVKGSRITVSVYAASMKDPKIYDIASLAKQTDGIFMMAYDFATTTSTQAIPTAPLYGYREGKYWYDVSTAVEDFLKVMPSDKLILGLPWYGYNYPISEDPQVKAARYRGYYYSYWWRGRKYWAYNSIPASAQTYSLAQENATELTGWDDYGKVGWRAYHEDGVWHMIFLEDSRSLKIKYDFAKEKNLGGVGMWALGFDSGTSEMWDLLAREFGGELASAQEPANN